MSAMRSIQESAQADDSSPRLSTIDDTIDSFLINQMSLRYKASGGKFLNKHSTRKLNTETTPPRYLN